MNDRVRPPMLFLFVCGCLCSLQCSTAPVVRVPDDPTREDHASPIRQLFLDSTRNAMNAAMATNDAGDWFCAWTERTSRGAVLHGMYLARGQRSGFSAFPIAGNRPAADAHAEDEFASVVFLDQRQVLVVWQRRSAGRHSVWARVLTPGDSKPASESDPGGVSLREAAHIGGGAPFRVDDGDAQAMMPCAARNAQGEVLIAWQDYRNGNADVYARRYHHGTRSLGESVRVNDDTARAIQGAPRLAADSPRGFLVLWPDARADGMWKFYYQRIGIPGARNVLIDSAQRKAMTTLIAGVVLPGDSAVFAWKDYRAGNSNIYRRVADLRAGGFRAAERVNDDGGDRWQRLAAADGDGGGHVALCWEDYRNTDGNQRGDIYLQAYGRDGTPAGGNVRVNDRDDRLARKMPLIVMDADGWILVLWHQGEEGAYSLYGQWMRHPVRRERANFCLTCDSGSED